MTAGKDERCPRCGIGGSYSGMDCARMRGPVPWPVDQQSYWHSIVCGDDFADDICEDCWEALDLAAEREPSARPIETTGPVP